MTTMFVQFGLFALTIVLIIYFKIYPYEETYEDCRRFARLLLASIAILIIDTTGWVIDGNIELGRIGFTTFIDALDLFFTTAVCWCWVQYVLYLIYGKAQLAKKWYKDWTTWALFLQFVLVACSQWWGIYFYVDSSGCYQRTTGYFIHTFLSMGLLIYSSLLSFWHYKKATDPSVRQDLFFVSWIVLIPFAGNTFQYYIYGYPTVWICMVLMILAVYIHIQDKRLAEERSERNVVLQRALRLAQEANIAKTEFFSRMSHDMRTPMNGILGLANLSLTEKDPAILHENMLKMKNVGEYMLGLINDTLDFQKIESGKLALDLAPVEVKALLESVCSMIRETAKEKGINFVVESDEVSLTKFVEADSLRVRQIFINLLSNAVKFTPAGGVVKLKLEREYFDDKSVKVKIIISDTGLGMSEKFLKEGIFKPFAQEYNSVTATTSGTGLGLSIVKRLTELMGGTITVKSKLGQGSTFQVTLQFRVSEKDAVVENTQRAIQKIEHMKEVLKGKNILLAEDHPLNAEITKHLLHKLGCKIVWAKDGQECVDIFASSQEGAYDAILMDVRMPILDGIAATKMIRKLPRNDSQLIPILAMTANAYPEDVKETKEAGMNAHLAKPVEPEKLYEALALYISKVKK